MFVLVEWVFLFYRGKECLLGENLSIWMLLCFSLSPVWKEYETSITEILHSYCTKAEAKDNMGIGHLVQTIKCEVSCCCSVNLPPPHFGKSQRAVWLYSSWPLLRRSQCPVCYWISVSWSWSQITTYGSCRLLDY